MANSSSPVALITIVILLALSNLCHVTARRGDGVCRASGILIGKAHSCNTNNDSECCKEGVRYSQFKCSPPVTARTRATMTLNSFAEGQDGGAESECDGKFHDDNEAVVALSTGWFHGGSRCGKKIRIYANGKSVLAKVVDECDSVNGCDAEHDFQPPCDNNIVDASPAVWKNLDIPKSQIGQLDVTWSDE